ncbi:MAG: tetratricopeptide repeat protein [Chloroflexi bacterium]|nr:MAG: tetratricopeptide repeat protein [Chloroflexota bacterium]
MTNSSHGLSGKELRSSLLAPLGIILGIWLVGVVAFLAVPGGFTTAVAVVIGLALLLFLVWWTRDARFWTRLLGLLTAVPALAGIAASLTLGQFRYLLFGFTATFFLLILYQLYATPISYRVAYRFFRRGEYDRALELVNKSLAARPDFWQSWQMRALIHLMHGEFGRAEQDAREAIRLNPKAHPVYNTLGQVYLAQSRFEEAAEVYAQAVSLASDLALYHYHLGLSHYRLANWAKAAEHLAAATRGTLPLTAYDLLAHYYLGQALMEMGDEETAAKALAALPNFADGVAYWQEQLAETAEYAHLALLKADLADIENLLAQQGEVNESTD